MSATGKRGWERRQEGEMRHGSPRRDGSLTQEGSGWERHLHWVWFQTPLGRTGGRVESAGGIRTRHQQQEELPSCVTGRITCQFEGLSGACEGRCVLEVKLQVSPPRPSSLASTFMTLVKLRLWGTHSLLSRPNSPCSGLVDSSRSSPLASVLLFCP